MIELLLIVIICGIVAWVVQSFAMPQPYKNIALAILAIIVILELFRILFGVGLGIPLR